MQKNHPKSNALRQTKICMAAAAMVTAAALPGYAMAQQVTTPSPAQWETDRNARVTALQHEISTLSSDLSKAVATHEFAERIGSQMNSLLTTVDAPITQENRGILLNVISENVDLILKVNDADLTSEGLAKKNELSALKSKIDGAASAVANGNRQDIGRALDELDAELKNHAAFLKDSAEALAPKQRVTNILKSKEHRVNGVASEEALVALKNTRQLDATTPGAATSGGQHASLTWSDKNLTNFMGNEASGDTHVAITQDSILELTSASGEKSDALHGAANGKRDVGTLHLAEDAIHRVAVNNGELTVHESIRGDGDLTVLVNAGGKLTFADDGVGIDGDMEDVALLASRKDTSAGEAGKIAFGKNTSSGNASIVLFEGAELTFAEGSNAGGSVIDINDGASATFDKANAAVSSISNSGSLGFNGSKLGAAELVNDDASLVGITGSELERAEIINLGIIAIDDSKGGNATIINGANGYLSIKDTALENLTLVNTGAVELSGSSTAHNARIEMTGGALSVADVNLAAADATPEKTLALGSLSGRGDVFTGDTTLVLGALNQNDHFEGTISRQFEAPKSNSAEASALPGLILSDLAAEASTKASVGSALVKVGTGNLTLSGDQGGVTRLSVDGGTLTAAHASALGAGTVTIAAQGAVALSKDVTGVTDLANAGTLHLGTNKLSVERYSSTEGATIKSRVEKVEDKLRGGKIHVSKNSDFSNSEIEVDVARNIDLSDVVGRFEVVHADADAKVTGGKVKVGSIIGGKKPDPIITNPEDPKVTPEDPKVTPGIDTTITEKSVVNFLAADGDYTANERAVLTSVDGVTVGDLTSGAVGGSVLAAMALQTAGTEEQRKSARMLSGESLINNVVAAQNSATTFQRSMQTRMIAGGTMFDDKTTNGATASDSGVAGWASFNGGAASQRGNGMSFDTKGLDGAIGVDKRLNKNTLIGGSLGFGNQESKAKGLPGESKINSFSLGLYGSHLTDENWFVNGGVSYTSHNVKTDRTIAARNASARLTGKTSGQTFGMFGEVGKRFDVSGVNIDPSVGLRVASTTLNGFDEVNRSGEGNNGLKVGQQYQFSTRGVLGVRLWSEVASVGGSKVAPSLRLSYEHELGNTDSFMNNRIHGAPLTFSMNGPALGRSILTADLGVDMQIKKQLEVHVGGNVSVRKGESALGGGISAKYRF